MQTWQRWYSEYMIARAFQLHEDDMHI